MSSGRGPSVRRWSSGEVFSPSSHLYLSHHPSPAKAFLLRASCIICLACHKAQHAKQRRLAFCRRRLHLSQPRASPHGRGTQRPRRRRSMLVGDFTAVGSHASSNEIAERHRTLR